MAGGEAERCLTVQVEVRPVAVGWAFKENMERAVDDGDRADGVGRADRPEVPPLGEAFRCSEGAGGQDVLGRFRVPDTQVGQPYLAGFVRKAEVQRTGPVHVARTELKRVGGPCGFRGDRPAIHRAEEEPRGDRLSVDVDLGPAACFLDADGDGARRGHGQEGKQEQRGALHHQYL